MGEQSGNTVFFRNTGTASLPAFAAPSTDPFGLVAVGLDSSPDLADVDGDGDLDLVSVGSDGLRLRLRPSHEEQLAHSLWTQNPMRLLAAVPQRVLLVAALGDDVHNRPRQESIRRARRILGGRLAVRWLPGGHELPLEQPVLVADALADLAASAALAGSRA